MSVPTLTATGRRTPAAMGVWPVVLCWLAVALDGFDLVVLGAVIPTLVGSGAIGFDPASATMVATVGLVGVGLGAVAIGPLTDRFGRRRSLIACVSVFSVCTLAIAAAPSVAVFAALRFLAGLGLGACLPTALAFITEYAPAGRGGSAVTRMMTGYHVGAVLTALLAIVLVPELGWRAMFVVGGLAGLSTVPLLWWRLPESTAFLDATRERLPLSEVVRGRFLRIGVCIWVASFMGLLLVYGLNTWLPQIMGQAGYSLGASLGLLLALNLGAVTGLLVAGRVSDTRGNKPTVLAWFGLAAVFLALLSLRMDSTALVYVAVFAAGIFVFSAQVLVYAFVGQLYPADLRGTALGLSAGVGRLGAIIGPFLGGSLVAAGVAYPWGFYAFAVAALLAVIALAAVPTRTLRVREDVPA